MKEDLVLIDGKVNATEKLAKVVHLERMGILLGIFLVKFARAHLPIHPISK